jgi:hypothetical protein
MSLSQFSNSVLGWGVLGVVFCSCAVLVSRDHIQQKVFLEKSICGIGTINGNSERVISERKIEKDSHHIISPDGND